MKLRRSAQFVGFAIDEDRKREHAQLPKFPDVLSAFDAQPYWTLKNLCGRVAKSEVRVGAPLRCEMRVGADATRAVGVLAAQAEIRQALREKCTYIHAGEHRQHYELRPEYRGTTHAAPVPVEDD